MKTPWMGLIICLVFGQAQAASFDCAQAKSEVEKLICTTEAVSALDDRVAAAYKKALQVVSDPAVIKAEQVTWLREQRNRCTDAACLQQAYENRRGQLHAAIRAAQSDPPLMPSDIEPGCLAPRIDWHNYQWALIVGQGKATCEEMLAYLKSRDTPPVCPQDRLPPNGNWTRPEVRILSAAEQQTLIRGIPQNERKFYEQKFKAAKLMRVIRGDITRDGIPENLLAVSPIDYRQSCANATRCASERSELSWGYISIDGGDYYDLLPMNDAGTQVDWMHQTLGAGSPPLMGGELIYYKGQPYWLSRASWFQRQQDDPKNRPPLDDPYRKMFSLNPLAHELVGQYGGPTIPTHFSNVGHIQGDPNADFCFFGYFHHDALKTTPQLEDKP